MHDDHAPAKNHYWRLLIMVVLSFVSMYILMYAMVDKLENIYPSFNQLYMAGLMTAPMVAFEIALMTAMYENTRWNIYLGYCQYRSDRVFHGDQATGGD